MILQIALGIVLACFILWLLGVILTVMFNE